MKIVIISWILEDHIVNSIVKWSGSTTALKRILKHYNFTSDKNREECFNTLLEGYDRWHQKDDPNKLTVRVVNYKSIATVKMFVE